MLNTQKIFFVVIIAGLWSLMAVAEQVTLDVPAEVEAGDSFDVKITTERSDQDYIYYTDVGADPKNYAHGYHKIPKGRPLTLRALVTPGTYAIRYVTQSKPQQVLAERTFVVTDVSATIEAPSSVVAGNEFKVRTTGPLHRLDFIALSDPDAADKDYKYGYQYTRKADAAGDIKFLAPIVPGEYSLRYILAGQPRARKLATTTFTVTDVSATLQPPTSVIDAGAKFDVAWTGPDTTQDFIGLTDMDGEPHSYTYGYQYTRKGNPVTLTAPTAPGKYLLRYLMRGQVAGQSYRDLAEATIVVGSVAATLDAPASVAVGANFTVAFTKPEKGRGYIAISAADTDGIDSQYGYKYARDKPVLLTAPDVAGDYIIRYIQEGNKSVVLAKSPLTVTPVSASLTLPDSVVARSEFKVGWQGPGNARDFISLEVEGISASYAYTRRGNPVTLMAPAEPGEYPVIYKMNTQELARGVIQVTPGVSYGSLRVVSSNTSEVDSNFGTNFGTNTGVLVILDASGSMWQKIDDRFRIELAREALVQLVSETIPAGTAFALRAFGQKEARSCRTDLEVPLAPLNPAAVVKTINAIKPQELSKTPIAASLAKVEEDLARVSGERVVVLVTDGEETCDGDPQAAIRKLVASGTDIRVNIVGFAIDEYALQKTFERWAQLGNGTYINAQSGTDLATAIRQAVNAPFEVVGASGDIVATGMSNGELLSLPVGSYVIRLRGSTEKGVAVAITVAEETLVSLD